MWNGSPPVGKRVVCALTARARLLAARVSGVLGGIGGLTIDPVLPDAFRMRRFYIRPLFPRLGIGGKLAAAT